MVRQIVEALLGEVGRQILFYYEQHALVINLIVLTYGLVILMAWLNLTRIYRHLVVAVAKQIHLNQTVNKDSPLKKILAAVKIPWDEPVQIAKFPLISGKTALLPVRKSAENVRKLLDEEELVKHALAVLNGKNPRSIAPSYRRMTEKAAALKKSKS